MSKARKIRDIVAKTGEYYDNNHNKKGRYINVGSLFYNEEEKSFFIFMNKTFNPAGVPNLSDKGDPDSVFLSCFNPDRKDGSGNTQATQSGGGDYASASGGSYSYQNSHQRPIDDDTPF